MAPLPELRWERLATFRADPYRPHVISRRRADHAIGRCSAKHFVCASSRRAGRFGMASIWRGRHREVARTFVCDPAFHCAGIQLAGDSVHRSGALAPAIEPSVVDCIVSYWRDYLKKPGSSHLLATVLVQRHRSVGGPPTALRGSDGAVMLTKTTTPKYDLGGDLASAWHSSQSARCGKAFRCR